MDSFPWAYPQSSGVHESGSTPVGVTQTVTYDNSQRISNVSAVYNGTTTLTSFAYGFTNPLNNQDTGFVYQVTENDSQRNYVTFNSLDALNRLNQWCVMAGGSTSCNTTPGSYAHLYTYAFDGNSNRTQVVADGATSNLTYNAANEWVQDVAGGQTDTINWDAAGNELGDNGFNNTKDPLQITYNERNQTATQTGCPTTTIPTGGCNVVWSMGYLGPGQAERTSQSSSAGTASYQYDALGMGKQTDSVTASSGTTFVRDPYGTLVAMRLGDPTSDYFLTDGFGSVVNLVGANGALDAAYFYCPTGNLAESGSGQYEFTNPYRMFGMFYDWRYATYWAGGVQVDANSGDPRQELPFTLYLFSTEGTPAENTSPQDTYNPYGQAGNAVSFLGSTVSGDTWVDLTATMSSGTVEISITAAAEINASSGAVTPALNPVVTITSPGSQSPFWPVIMSLTPIAPSWPSNWSDLYGGTIGLPLSLGGTLDVNVAPNPWIPGVPTANVTLPFVPRSANFTILPR